jgi:hypothetical protein
VPMIVAWFFVSFAWHAFKEVAQECAGMAGHLGHCRATPFFFSGTLVYIVVHIASTHIMWMLFRNSRAADSDEAYVSNQFYVGVKKMGREKKQWIPIIHVMGVDNSNLVSFIHSKHGQMIN